MLSNLLFAIIFSFPQILNLGAPLDNPELSSVSSSLQEKVIFKESSKKALAPENTTGSLGVKVNAKSALIVDRKSGEVLFAKNPEDKMAMASITKLMTTLVALDSKIDLEDSVVIENNFVELEGADIDLQQTEELKMKDLFYGALVASGNDAASALAYAVSGDLEDFVLQMNKKADELGMINTHFANVTGLDTQGHYSTAYDLAILANAAFSKPKILEAASTKKYEIVPKEGDTRMYNNTDKLLTTNYPKIKAGKTGYTENAGFCLLALSEDNKGNQIITILLGADLNGNQFQETKALIDWAYKTYKWSK